MDKTQIVVAVLAFLGTLSGAYFANTKAAALIAYRLEQLEKKVEAHNNLIDRMYKAETEIAVLKEELNDIEEDVNVK